MSVYLSNAHVMGFGAMYSCATAGAASHCIPSEAVVQDDAYSECASNDSTHVDLGARDIECVPKSITAHDANIKTPAVHHPNVSGIAGVDYLLTIVLIGAIGMVHGKAKGGGGWLAKLKGMFGGSGSKDERLQDASEAETILMIAREVVPPEQTSVSASSNAKPDPQGTLIGTTALLKILIGNKVIDGQIDVHKNIGIAQSVVRAIAKDPLSVSSGTIPSTTIRTAMAKHDVFAFKDDVVPFPTIGAEQSFLFRKAYDDLIGKLKTDPGAFIEDCEDPSLLRARIEAVAEYYIHKWIHMLTLLWQVPFYGLTEEHLMGVMDKVAYDLSLARKNVRKFYGIDEKAEDENRGIVTTIGGRNVYAWKLAHALKIDTNEAQVFLNANIGTVSEYVAAWESMPYATQLIYSGGFEEFLAQDILPGGTNTKGEMIPMAIVRDRKRFQRQAMMNEADWIGKNGTGSAAQLRRVVHIGGRIVDIQTLAANLRISIHEAIALIDKYSFRLKDIDSSLWNDPLIKEGGGYDRVVAYALGQLMAHDKESTPRETSSHPPSRGRKRRVSPPIMGAVVPESLREFAEAPWEDSDLLVEDDDD